MTLRAIDLCCGAGGWACAAAGLPIHIELAVDLWDTCCRTYRMNHAGTEVLCGDLREAEVQDHIMAAADGVDLVLGAIPCEWLSYRRRANRVSDDERDRERQTLSSVLSLVAAVRPRYWCLEDVKGLTKELPPDVPWLELNSSFDSAQRRKRIYVGRFPAPIMRSCSDRLADKVRPGPYRVGKRSADRTIRRSQSFTTEHVMGAWPREKSPTVCSWSSRRDAEIVIVAPHLPGGRRQIEWQEAAALQGFPTDYLFYGSPTDVWKMIAQAVQIDTARAILLEIVKHALPPRQALVAGAGAGETAGATSTGH